MAQTRFVPPVHIINVQVTLDANEFRRVRQTLHATFPELARLANQRQAQMVNSNGLLRILPVNGGEIPEDITADAVAGVIERALSESAAFPFWADAQTRHYARRGR